MPTMAGYQLRDEVYRDAHIAVYRGCRDDGTLVIVKLLHAEYPELEELARLRREYETTKNLPLEGIPRPLALEPHGNGLALVLEDSGSQPLQSFFQNNLVDVPLFLKLALDMTEIVGQLHRHNIVHCDIQPRHWLVHPQTHRARLVDFGNAMLLHHAQFQDAAHPPSSTRFWSQAPFSGTLAYMSPEQTGRTAQSVDHRSDLYSLGATFYQMLTGQAPFEGSDSLELLHALLARPPLSPQQVNPDVPGPIADIVLKLLAKTPDERYQSAHGLKADWERCLDSWQRHVEIEPFALGAHDFSRELRIPARLYGREEESAILLGAFERARRGTNGLLLVEGYSGIGKSSLVRDIQGSVLRQGGYFVSGKFDQFRRDLPYAAIIRAFRELIAHLLTQGDQALEGWKTRLQDALGESGQVVAAVIPEIELIIGAQPRLPELGPLETQNRFQVVFGNFIRVFAQASHPLVLFLDDLQWADAASLKLLRVLESPNGPRHLLVLCAVRNNEVNASHPAMLALDEVRRAGGLVQAMQLEALQLPHVTQWIADILRCDFEHAMPLSHLVWEKTAGNPFFVNQMLQLLWRENLLFFDGGESRWKWDSAGIRSAAITDNVVELLAAKIGLLSPATQQTLTLAACIGNAFDVRTLSIVSRKDPTETSAQVWEALREGLLLPLQTPRSEAPRSETHHANSQRTDTTHAWKFAHDRVQQAAHSLLGENQRQQMHLQIGRLLLQAVGDDADDERLFDIAGHFNRALALVNDAAERRLVLGLNLRAGRKAKSATAYEAALRHFTVASDLLPANAWNDDYATTFALHKERAECEFLAGNTQVAQQMFKVLKQRAKRVLDEAEVVCLHVQLCTILNDFAQAIDVGLKGLARLGMRLPAQPSQAVILRNVMTVRNHRGRRKISDLANAPHLRDPHQKATLGLLSNMVAPLYVSGRQNLFTLAVLKMTSLSLRFGNTDVSAQAYALYGVVLGSGLGDYRAGYELGEVALQLCDQFDNPGQECKTYFTFPTFISPWRTSLSSGDSFLRRSYEMGLQSGNTVFAGYAVVNLTAYQSLRGQTLTEVRAEADRYIPFLKWTKDPNQLAMVIFTRQMSRCLQGATRDNCSLSDDDHDEAELLQGLRDNAAARLWYRIVKQKLFYLNGAYGRALEMAQAAESDLSSLFGTPYIVEEKFFHLLTLTALYAKSSTRLPLGAERTLRRGLKQLKKWAANSEDFKHKYLLVLAEMARLQGRPQAIGLYDAAVQSARKCGYIQNEALANELAARFYAAQGNIKVARSYLTSARYGYLRWGATTKAAQLEKDPLYRAATRRDDENPTERGATFRQREPLSALDLASVVKTSQALSGEMDLGRLIRHLMNYAMENAGAQSGLLLLQRNGRWVVEARVQIEVEGKTEGEVEILQSLPLEESDHWPVAILNYVVRTGENLVLHQAHSSELFANTPYVQKHQPKSVLCVPLVRQNTSVGVLYLENNLTTGAFTPQRTEVLSVIAAQAAIALENALLLHTLREATEKLRLSHEQLEETNRTLEQKVDERTRELELKNAQLGQTLRQLTEMQDKMVMQEKMASLGALTAGVAHEIKNPLNFVNNFAEISGDLTQELMDELSTRSGDNASQMQAVLHDLKQNLHEINHHGKRADSIVNSMLLHSRSQVGQMQASDLNEIVREAVHLAYHAMRAQQADFGLRLEEDYDPNIGDIDVVPQDMSRVFLNIVNNACYATHQRQQRERDFTPHLRISTSSNDQYVQVRIADNGCGMPRSVVEKIFNPFFTTKPAREGTGLGLSMSYEIVTQHGGEIVVQSEEGRGTEFLISLPRRTPLNTSLPESVS